MEEKSSHTNAPLEAVFEAALRGETASLKNFFRAFLQGPLFVPERHQELPFTSAVQYPNDFLNLLAIQHEDRAIIPVFSNRTLVNEWIEKELTAVELSGKALLERVPENWWLCINPGSEISKEISPWEIDQLRGGEANFEAIINELLSEEIIQPLSVRPPLDGEYLELQTALKEFAGGRGDIRSLALLVEEGKNSENEIVLTPLIGVEVEAPSRGAAEQIKDQLRAIADRVQIGADQPKILVGMSGRDSIILQPFRTATPVFERAAKRGFRSLFSRFLG